MVRLLALILALLLAIPAADAGTIRRSVRVDFGGWVELNLDDCPGSSASSFLLQRDGFLFAGPVTLETVPDRAYCQTSTSEGLTTGFYFYVDEPGLKSLLAEQEGPPGCEDFVDCVSQASGLRYSYVDDSFEGFQWGFFFFPQGLALATLYGSENTVLDEATRIERLADGATIWDAAGNEYGGEYFCFDTGGEGGWRFLGPWDGQIASQDAACEGALRRGFGSGFE